jgi:hypothetical protein
MNFCDLNFSGKEAIAEIMLILKILTNQVDFFSCSGKFGCGIDVLLWSSIFESPPPPNLTPQPRKGKSYKDQLICPTDFCQVKDERRQKFTI